MTDNSLYYMELPQELDSLIGEIALITYEVYLVGGFVRDHLLFSSKEYNDVDIAVNYDIEKLMEKLEDIGFHVVATGLKFGVFQVNLKDGINVDIAHFRAETYEANSRKPIVTSVSTPKADASRRDFTINSMMLKYLGIVYEDHIRMSSFEILDYFDGIEDGNNANRKIRAVGNPKERFSEDALRCFRAIRFAAKYNFIIEENTMKAIQEICKA